MGVPSPLLDARYTTTETDARTATTTITIGSSTIVNPELFVLSPDFPKKIGIM